MSKPRLKLALPSKGRLREMAFSFFRESGIPVKVKSEREYTGKLSVVDGVEVQFYRPDEIPEQVEGGEVHLGVTGVDLYAEHVLKSDDSTILMEDLGFGHARLVVGVPRSWVDVNSIEDLVEVAEQIRHEKHRGLRIATGFFRLSRDYLARHGITDYRLIESLGATEGAPASGTADIIIDLTSTGSTLVQNHLKMIEGGTVISSQACLLASFVPKWDEPAKAALRQIIDFIEARWNAEKSMRLHFYASSAQSKRLLAKNIDPRLNECLKRTKGDHHALTLHLNDMYPVVEALRAAGCDEITAHEVDYAFKGSNETFARFEKLLKK